MNFIDDKYCILEGNCLDTLKTLPDNSIQMCVTSPPYYGLRDYGTGTWVGGDINCPHYRTSKYSENDCTGHKLMGKLGQAVGDAIYKSVCPLCGAVRVDEQIGLEETPEEYIENLVKVFREVKRVLKDDGTLWINIGDTYNGNKTGNTESIKNPKCAENNSEFHKKLYTGAKRKDLIGIPWMLAFALRNDGWYLRQDIIWAKPNPMPEPAKDRCVKSHEYIFLFSKKATYKFNYENIQEDSVTIDNVARNKRDVWNIPVNSYKDAHFATYPLKLVEPCVLAGSNEDDIVLDPFNGSGTSGIVAMNLNRKYIGCELNPEYIKLTIDRFNKESLHIDTIKNENDEVIKYQKDELW